MANSGSRARGVRLDTDKSLKDVLRHQDAKLLAESGKLRAQPRARDEHTGLCLGQQDQVAQNVVNVHLQRDALTALRWN